MLVVDRHDIDFDQAPRIDLQVTRPLPFFIRRVVDTPLSLG